MDDCDTRAFVALENVKQTLDKLVFCHFSELNEPLRSVMPVLEETLQEMYTKNNFLVQNDKTEALNMIKTNFQVALVVMDISNDILRYLMTKETLAFNHIPSVPVCMANMLFLTFDHCKNSQKSYSCIFKSVTEILDLFKKTQEVHNKYLNFLDTHLMFDFLNEDEIIAYKKILEIILKISKTLSGINMKSMADNWKGFITLIQKNTQNVEFFDLSPAIQILTEEANQNLSALAETESADAKKSSQIFKVTGFLVKVVLKLLEIELNVEKYFEEIFKFFITIYSWNGSFFQTNRFPEEVIDAIYSLFHLCSESVTNLLCRDSAFFKEFCFRHEKFIVSKQKFGYLMFINALLKELPVLLNHDLTIIHNLKVSSLLHSIFNLTKSCYQEFCEDYNSGFYEELIVNLVIIILLFPNQFAEVEKILLECVLEENIWTSLIATDVWCLTLKFSTEDVSRKTVTVLLKKTQDLNLGKFHETPAVVRLKVLIQRILKIHLCNSGNDEITKYNPTQNIQVWKIFSLRNIPLSHRYYLEFLMCDILEKMDIIEKRECSTSDILNVMESLDILSYTKFSNLEINLTRLIPFVAQLWSFDLQNVSQTNYFLKFFVYKLLKLTIAVDQELSGQNFVTILTQLKNLLNEPLCKLLLCELLQVMSKRNFNFSEKNSLFPVLANVFRILLTDKNVLIVHLALESFVKISESRNYEIIVHKLSTDPEMKRILVDYTQRNAASSRYNSKYFEKIQGFTLRHCCCDWTNSIEQPVFKKIKVESDSDVIINNLKNDSDKLAGMIKGNELTSKQRSDLKGVINRLDKLLNGF